MGRIAFSVLCVAALLAIAVGARRHSSAVEEHSQGGKVICPMKAEAFGFQWQYPAKSCLMCNPISAFNQQFKEDLFSATDCSKNAASECKALKHTNVCACTPANGNGKASFAFFLNSRKKTCDNAACFKQFGDLQSMMQGYQPSFTPNAFENPMSRCKKCQAATTPEEREAHDCDAIRMNLGANSDATRAQMEELGVIVPEAPEVDLKDVFADEAYEEEEEEEEDEDEAPAADMQDEEEDDSLEVAAAPSTTRDEDIYEVAAIVAEEDTPEELQAVEESPCPPKVLWNVAGYPRCRDAATKRFVLTDCCAALVAEAKHAGVMCSKLIGAFDLPKCSGAVKSACKQSTNNCKVAARKPKKVFRRAGIPGSFPKGYSCKVSYMCDFRDRPAVGPMDGTKCKALGGTAKNMCTATTP